MALWPSDCPRMFFTSPVERMMVRVFDNSLRDLNRSLRAVAPYWLDQPALEECNIGNAVGKVTDDKEKFGVQVDVTQFHPEDLSVNVQDNELVIEGHHQERNDSSGTIERHFIRKYTIPDDVDSETIQSHLSDKGVLSISAKKRAIQGPKSRTIPIQAAPREAQAAVEQKQNEDEKPGQKYK